MLCFVLRFFRLTNAVVFGRGCEQNAWKCTGSARRIGVRKRRGAYDGRGEVLLVCFVVLASGIFSAFVVLCLFVKPNSHGQTDGPTGARVPLRDIFGACSDCCQWLRFDEVSALSPPLFLSSGVP